MIISREKLKNSEKTILQFHFVHHESHLKSLGLFPGVCAEMPSSGHLMCGSASV
jgi:hypothetical protein